MKYESLGVCPGCLECAKEHLERHEEVCSTHGTVDTFSDDCPCGGACEVGEEPLDEYLARFRALWETGKTEGGDLEFATSDCDLCGSSLGGTRYVFHYVDETDTIVHAYCCTDCAENF